VDPDARHAHKTVHRRTDGFTAHVVVEPDTGLITECALTRASGAEASEATVGIGLLADDETIAGPVEVLGDSAYGTGPALAALDGAGHTAVIKPWRLRPAVPDGFTLDDFTVDEAVGTATCPHGITRPITRSRKAVFGAACRGCPLRARCTTAARGRTLQLHEHDALMRAHRARAADPAFQATYRRHRPMVERSIAWVTRGSRRVPYRGVAKNDAWLHLRVTGINLRRLLVDVSVDLNASLQIVRWRMPDVVQWVPQPVTVIQDAPGTHALVLPSAGGLPDGSYRLGLAITRRWFDTLDPVGPGNAYLDDAAIEFAIAG
jgi:hypothetical protein